MSHDNQTRVAYQCFGPRLDRNALLALSCRRVATGASGQMACCRTDAIGDIFYMIRLQIMDLGLAEGEMQGRHSRA